MRKTNELLLAKDIFYEIDWVQWSCGQQSGGIVSFMGPGVHPSMCPDGEGFLSNIIELNSCDTKLRENLFLNAKSSLF